MKSAERLTMLIMRNVLLFLTAALMLPAQQIAESSNPAPLKLVTTFSLPANIRGHFEHLIVDTKGGRLFATPEDFHAVLVMRR